MRVLYHREHRGKPVFTVFLCAPPGKDSIPTENRSYTLLAAHKRLKYFYIFEFIRGHGEHIAVEHNKVGEFSGFEGSLAVLFKAGVGSVTCVKCERLFDRNAFLRG